MPASRNPHLSARWTTAPAEAAHTVLTALRGAATIADAAKALGVGRRTLYRWLRERPELAGVKKTWKVA